MKFRSEGKSMGAMDLPAGIVRYDRLEQAPPWPMAVANLIGSIGREGVVSRETDAQLKLRAESADYLNREFEMFLSLLPSRWLNDFFEHLFGFRVDAGKWAVVGRSVDFEQVFGLSFMPFDTLLYTADAPALLTLDAKIDATVNARTALDYAFFHAALESLGAIKPNSELFLAFVSADAASMQSGDTLAIEASKQFAAREFPATGLPAETTAALAARVEDLLGTMTLAVTDWQHIGLHWAARRADLGMSDADDTLGKLIEGFLWTLRRKFSPRHARPLYTE